jgi:inhibitor of KinA
MRLERLGDSAVILYELHMPCHRVAKALESLPYCRDAVASYETVGLYFEPGAARFEDIEASIQNLLNDLPDEPAKTLRVPVCFELGEDLANACSTLGLGENDLANEFCEQPYQCFAIGFTPGFPYLGYLPARLAGLPRRETPRVKVPAGSVAITGRQAGIYPSETPGGWNLIGRTPLEIVNLKDGYFPLTAGDSITFYRISQQEFEQRKGERL